MYPRYFLTHHFWTLQQRSEFAVINLRDRLLYNRNVFRDLQSKLEQVKNDDQYEQWSSILGKLGSGLHPTIDEILSVEKLFTEPPYNTKSLNYTHVVSCSLDSMPYGLLLWHLYLFFFHLISYSLLFSFTETFSRNAWHPYDIFS